jgi:hypothetical protein
MCLAIYKPADTAADWDAYESGHRQNNDSWGFAAVVNGEIVTRCGLGKFPEFREAFEPFADRQAIIHFRWATHGKLNEDNCHPFMVSDGLAMIHNGVVSIKCNVEPAMSDTWHFNELILKPMHSRDPEFYNRSDVIYSQEVAHDTSKFVFLRADGDWRIWNNENGVWESDGHWYSNDSYEVWPASWSRKGTLASQYASQVAFSRVVDDRETYSYDDEDRKAESETYTTTPKASASPFDDEEEEADAYTQMRVDELRTHGLSMSAIDEVLNLFGPYGIEALHDAM